MFGFVKTLIVLAVLAAVAYFVFFVQLGDKTLFRHLVGISETEEAHELKKELSKKAGDLKDDVVSKLPAAPARQGGAEAEERATSVGGSGPATPGAPLSEQSDADRRALKELIERAGSRPEKR
jgi:hypothetical protein